MCLRTAQATSLSSCVRGFAARAGASPPAPRNTRWSSRDGGRAAMVVEQRADSRDPKRADSRDPKRADRRDQDTVRRPAARTQPCPPHSSGPVSWGDLRGRVDLDRRCTRERCSALDASGVRRVRPWRLHLSDQGRTCRERAGRPRSCRGCTPARLRCARLERRLLPQPSRRQDALPASLTTAEHPQDLHESSPSSDPGNSYARAHGPSLRAGPVVAPDRWADQAVRLDHRRGRADHRRAAGSDRAGRCQRCRQVDVAEDPAGPASGNGGDGQRARTRRV